MRLIALGDIHLDAAVCHSIPGIGQADAILITGDLTNFGGRREAAAVLATLATANPRLFAVAGNLDRPEVNDLMAEQGISLHGRAIRFGELAICGLGGSNPTPFATPNELAEDELARLLAAAWQQTAGADTVLLVSHPPPWGTRTDRLASGQHVGSRAVRAFIESHQPALCLTGHIHEARGEDRIGATRIINPGLVRQGGWIEVTWQDGILTGRLHLGPGG
ncbi:MAG: metallophosphoesterase [Thermodesulfobacteriota bacterium]